MASTIIYLLLAVASLVCLCLPGHAARSVWQEVTIRKLNVSDGSLGAPTSLGSVVRALGKAAGEVDGILVYLWQADPKWNPPFYDVYFEEISSIQSTVGDAPTTFSVAVVNASGAEMKDLCARIAGALKRAEVTAPVYIAHVGLVQGMEGIVPPGKLRAAKYLEWPEVLVVNPGRPAVVDARGGAPAMADDWVNARTGVDKALPRAPADCSDSWFRHSIALVCRQPGSGLTTDAHGLFHPKRWVTRGEFRRWLSECGAKYDLIGPGDETDPISRELAFAATVAAVYGTSPRQELERIPCRRTEDFSADDPRRMRSSADWWRSLFRQMAGHEAVAPPYEDYLVLALADGLLYEQPTLRARHDLSRDVAAWLLGWVLARSPEGGPTGLLVDARGLYLTRDTRFGENGLWVNAGGAVRQLYPIYDAHQPRPALGFAPTLCVRDEREAAIRVGVAPELAIPIGLRKQTPQSTAGVILWEKDVMGVESANVRNGLLDYWRVAIICSEQAGLATPFDGPLPREGLVLRVLLPGAVIPETVNASTVQIRSPAPGGNNGRTVAAEIRRPERNEDPWDVCPTDRLMPGSEYELTVSGVATSDGWPLAPARWTFSTEDTVFVSFHAPAAPESLRNSELLVAGTRVGAIPGPTDSVKVPRGRPLDIDVRATSGRIYSMALPAVETDQAIVLPPFWKQPDHLQLTVADGTATSVDQGAELALRVTAVDESGGEVRLYSDMDLYLSVTKGRADIRSPTYRIGRGTSSVDAGLIPRSTGPVDIKAVPLGDYASGCREGSLTLISRLADSTVTEFGLHSERMAVKLHPGGGFAIAQPKLWRWREPGRERDLVVTAVNSQSARQYEQVAAVVRQGQYAVDATYGLRFARADVGTTLEVSYYCRPGRAGVLVLSEASARPIADAVRGSLLAVLPELGYRPFDVTESLDLWRGWRPENGAPRGEDVAAALAALRLDDLLAVVVRRAASGTWLQASLWSPTHETGRAVERRQVDPLPVTGATAPGEASAAVRRVLETLVSPGASGS